MTGPAPLLTERLRLNAIRRDDAARLAVLCNNWNVARWLARVPFPYLLEDGIAFCNLIEETAPAGQDLVWAIRRREETNLMGLISVTNLHGEEPELGYWLGQPFWGQRLMSEAAKAVVQVFFARTAHPRLYSGAFVGNEASLRIQAALGFTETGLGRRWCMARGEDIAHHFLVLERTVWEAQNPHA